MGPDAMTDEAEWKIINENVAIVIHRQVNVIFGCLGYLLFAFIIYACIKKRVFAKRIPDVLLFLIVAFIVDIAKTRMYLYFIFNMPEQERMIWTMPTTISACTLGLWTFFAYFMVTYVDAIISIHRFIVRFIRQNFSVSFVFIAVGIVFTLQVALFFETVLQGTPETIHSNFTMYCTKAYVLKEPFAISANATLIAMTVAPVLSMFMVFKRSVRREQGVTAFIFLSSLATAAFTFGWLFLVGADIPEDYRYDVKKFMFVVYTILDFRFPILCMLAALIVGDIRRAVFATISRTEIKENDEEYVTESIDNPAYLESCVYPHGQF